MKELLASAGLNTLLGMGTVFIMLIIMSLIIYCFRFLNVAQKKAAKKTEEPKQASRPAPPTVYTQTQATEDVTDDLELVAVIAAAIAASAQVPVDSFQVRTIKRRR